MTDASISAGLARVSTPPVQIFASTKKWIKSVMYSMQYAQMIRAMNMLPDDVLMEIGVKRSDIHLHCKKLLD